MKKYDNRYMDSSVRAQDDFFQHAVGGWLAKNPIPPEKARWGTFSVLREKAAKDLYAIVKDAVAGTLMLGGERGGKKGGAAEGRAVGGTESQQLRDFFRSGMDMKLRNKLGISPIAHWLAQVDAIDSVPSLIDAIITLHADGFSPLFAVFVGQDDKQSTKYITNMVQSGLTLGERDFYLKKDARNETIRAEFVKYAAKMFVRGGASAARAADDAKNLLALETALARISMSNVDRRDITKVYHKFSLAAFAKEAPAFPWKKFLHAQGLQKATQLLVHQPAFLRDATALLAKAPLESWKAYLRFHVLDGTAHFLTSGFATDAFDFYGRVLNGKEKMEPQWKRVLGVVNGALGDILGKEYVKRHFPPEAKEQINTLVDDLFAAYRVRIQALDWMSPVTKKKALTKLSQMSRKLGYPNKWRSYAGLHIDPTDYVGNVFRASKHEEKHEYGRLGKPVDRDEWFMHPHDVNAYYMPPMNDIAFPAAILQPPFFDFAGDAAFNYGAIGSVIGHEITHGFDDQGCMYDGKGNYKNWWTEADKKAFNAKAKVLVQQFNAYRVHGEPVNGKLTLGENIADLGGLSIAFDAYMKHLERTGGVDTVIGGHTPAERFFLGFVLFECAHSRKEYELLMLVSDPHSPSEFRVNGPASNLPEFYAAYGVKKGDKLFREEKKRAKIW